MFRLRKKTILHYDQEVRDVAMKRGDVSDQGLPLRRLSDQRSAMRRLEDQKPFADRVQMVSDLVDERLKKGRRFGSEQEVKQPIYSLDLDVRSVYME